MHQSTFVKADASCEDCLPKKKKKKKLTEENWKRGEHAEQGPGDRRIRARYGLSRVWGAKAKEAAGRTYSATALSQSAVSWASRRAAHSAMTPQTYFASVNCAVKLSKEHAMLLMSEVVKKCPSTWSSCCPRSRASCQSTMWSTLQHSFVTWRLWLPVPKELCFSGAEGGCAQGSTERNVIDTSCRLSVHVQRFWGGVAVQLELGAARARHNITSGALVDEVEALDVLAAVAALNDSCAFLFYSGGFFAGAAWVGLQWSCRKNSCALDQEHMHSFSAFPAQSSCLHNEAAKLERKVHRQH